MLERVQRALAGCQPGLQGLRHADIRRLARRVDGTWKVARVAWEHAADGFDERLVVRVPRRATGRELHARWHVGAAGSAADFRRPATPQHDHSGTQVTELQRPGVRNLPCYVRRSHAIFVLGEWSSSLYRTCTSYVRCMHPLASETTSWASLSVRDEKSTALALSRCRISTACFLRRGPGTRDLLPRA